VYAVLLAASVIVRYISRWFSVSAVCVSALFCVFAAFFLVPSIIVAFSVFELGLGFKDLVLEAEEEPGD